LKVGQYMMKRIYYGWIIVGIGLLIKMSGLGFGRFAYAMLLSHMRESLSFNYSQMGLLSGGILLGYLLFSLGSGVMATRFGSKKVIILSLFSSALSMFALSRLSDFFALLFFTFIMGAGASGVHIPMTTLPMPWFEKQRLGRALGIIQGGTGLGILVTGFLLPPLLTTMGREAWRSCWFLMSCITFVVTITGLILLKEKPAQTDLSPPQKRENEAPVPGPTMKGEMSLRTIIVVYFIFGFAYNIYATYFVAFMVEEVHLAQKTAGNIWAMFGWLSMVSGLLWGFLSDRLGRRRVLIWNNGLISLALLLPLFFHQLFFIITSTFLFGLTFIGTVTVIAASIGDQAGEKRASLYGLVTLIHGIGQLIGTTSGGFLKDLSQSFQLTLTASLIGFLLCFILIVLNKKRTPDARLPVR
jgi:MFS family permease